MSARTRSRKKAIRARQIAVLAQTRNLVGDGSSQNLVAGSNSGKNSKIKTVLNNTPNAMAGTRAR